MNKRLLFVANDPSFFISHRLPVALGARRSGYDVHIATMPGAAVDEINKQGFSHYELPLSRSGKNPLTEFVAIASIYKLFRDLRPDIVHLVTIKPVLYGGIAARLACVRGVVAAVSGLGFTFLASGLKASLVRFAIKSLYRIALGGENLRVIFQNPDDRNVLLNMGALNAERVEMIRGSGVDLARYPALPESEGEAVVCLAARLLHDKGVREFVEAAHLLRRRGIEAKFWLIGDADKGNPSTVTTEELECWRQNGAVELLGYRTDIAQLFAAAHIIVLPSYREGLPKVLVEAAACGRAVITTDVPGCRDAIEPDVTGLLVPVCDAVALADAIQRLVEDPGLRQSFGQAGRVLAEREFAIENIVQAHLDIYKKLEVGA